MKLGFVSAILPDLSLEEVLAFAGSTGYRCVEVMCWPSGKAERRYAGVTHIDVTKLTQNRADEINALCAARGVSLSALGYYPNPLDPDPVASAFPIHLEVEGTRIRLDDELVPRRRRQQAEAGPQPG